MNGQKNMKPQTRAVLNYMHKYGSITAAEAFNILGVGVLHARISELRHDHDFHVITDREPNRNGNGWHAVYKLSSVDYERLEG